MKRLRRIFPHAVIAGCVALVYVALAVMSAGCVFARADRIQDHHQHSEEGSSPQNAFCAWACQATSDVAMAPEFPKAIAWLVVEPTVPIRGPSFPSSGLSTLRSRAPPTPARLLYG